MKKWISIAIISGCLLACKSANIATPAPNETSKPAVDTAMQGDKMKDPTTPQ